MADEHFVLSDFIGWFMPRIYEVCAEREIDDNDMGRVSHVANGVLCSLGAQQGWDSVVYTFINDDGLLIFATYGPDDLNS